MQQPTSSSQWAPNHTRTENQHNAHLYIPSASLHPAANSPLLPASLAQHAPIFSSQDTELHPGLLLGLGNRPDGPVGTSMPAIGQNNSQSLTDAPWMRGRSHGSSTDQPDHFSVQRASGYCFADPAELPPQERGAQTPHWLSHSSPPAGQSPLYPSIEDPSNFDRTLRCEWAGCRSVTVFRRESELMRHIKTIHVSPKAHRCTQLNCAMAFGRRDHLKAHQKTHQGW